MTGWVKPWKTTDVRTGRPHHWSYNPNVAWAVGVVLGAATVIVVWWLS